MPNYPKFEKKLEDRFQATLQSSLHAVNYGVIMEYNNTYNTATVLLAQQGSDQPGELFRDVPCPVNRGVQSSYPKPGYPCIVVFKDGRGKSPFVTAYFNHLYNQFDYQKQTRAKSPIPRFMLTM